MNTNLDGIWSCILEISPRPKGRPRFTRSGHAFTDAKTRAYEKELVSMLELAKPPKFTDSIAVSICFHVPRPKAAKHRLYPCVRPDVDNQLKAILDAANGILWDDDGQIVDLYGAKRYVEEGVPRIEIFIASKSMLGDKLIDPANGLN